MHIFLTGASSGIGEALAREFDQTGNKISLVARRETLLSSLSSELNCDSHVIVADLAQPKSIDQAITKAEEKFGPIDLLINNAGIQRVADSMSIEQADYEKIFQVNVLSPMKIIKNVLPKMLKRNSGAIINIASVGSFSPTPYMSYYTASKAAIANFSESLAAEYHESQVHIMTVYPGPIKTPMEERVKDIYDNPDFVEAMPSASSKDLAKEISKQFNNKAERLIYPKVYAVSRLIPDIAHWVSARFSPKPK